MSKSLGNFITVHDLLSKGVKGEVIRFALMSTRYNEPLDWSEKLLSDAEKVMNRLYRKQSSVASRQSPVNQEILSALRDDLNTPKALAVLQTLGDDELLANAQFMGLMLTDAVNWFKGDSAGEDTLWIEVQIEARNAAKKARDFATSDAIREALKARGIVLEDSATGTTWRRA